MARPTEFDRSKALEAAMKRFWAYGYSNTSLPELLDVMLIARSSFYASFGTKRELFIECLELYGRRTEALVDRLTSIHPPQALPRAFFEKTLLLVAPSRAQWGCMLVNTVLEMDQADPDLRRRSSESLLAIEGVFADAFRRAELDRNSSAVQSPQQLASLVMTLNFGLRVQIRQLRSRDKIKPVIESSLALLELQSA